MNWTLISLKLSLLQNRILFPLEFQNSEAKYRTPHEKDIQKLSLSILSIRPHIPTSHSQNAKWGNLGSKQSWILYFWCHYSNIPRIFSIFLWRGFEKKKLKCEEVIDKVEIKKLPKNKNSGQRIQFVFLMPLFKYSLLVFPFFLWRGFQIVNPYRDQCTAYEAKICFTKN